MWNIYRIPSSILTYPNPIPKMSWVEAPKGWQSRRSFCVWGGPWHGDQERSGGSSESKEPKVSAVVTRWFGESSGYPVSLAGSKIQFPRLGLWFGGAASSSWDEIWLRISWNDFSMWEFVRIGRNGEDDPDISWYIKLPGSNISKATKVTLRIQFHTPAEQKQAPYSGSLQEPRSSQFPSGSKERRAFSPELIEYLCAPISW